MSYAASNVIINKTTKLDESLTRFFLLLNFVYFFSLTFCVCMKTIKIIKKNLLTIYLCTGITAITGIKWRLNCVFVFFLRKSKINSKEPNLKNDFFENFPIFIG